MDNHIPFTAPVDKNNDDETLYEHLISEMSHPDFLGQKEMAEVFYEGVKKLGGKMKHVDNFLAAVFSIKSSRLTLYAEIYKRCRKMGYMKFYTIKRTDEHRQYLSELQQAGLIHYNRTHITLNPQACILHLDVASLAKKYNMSLTLIHHLNKSK